MRKIEKHYQDPLDIVWLNAAKLLGISVVRDQEVFAAWDGKGTLRIGTAETLDPDDSLAQMIFHEICHALVEGPEAFHLPDWGLEANSDVCREHACIRLQAALADQFGLRNFLATTTDFRVYYDDLGPNPLEGESDPAIPLALSAWQRAQTGDWSNPIRIALQHTRSLLDIAKQVAPVDSLWSDNVND